MRSDGVWDYGSKHRLLPAKGKSLGESQTHETICGGVKNEEMLSCGVSIERRRIA